MGIQLKNNASGTLATAINASDTGIVLTTGNGASFPTLGASDYFYATLESTGGTLEIIKVTARSGDSMTVVRAQEGTTAQSFAAGSRIELRVTAQSVLDVVDQVDAQQVSYEPPFTGSVTTNVEAKLAQYVSVKDFGAVGDGVTNDTTAFTNARAASSGKYYIPEGVYLVNSSPDVWVDSFTASGNSSIKISATTYNVSNAFAGRLRYRVASNVLTWITDAVTGNDIIGIQNSQPGTATYFKRGLAFTTDSHFIQCQPATNGGSTDLLFQRSTLNADPGGNRFNETFEESSDRLIFSYATTASGAPNFDSYFRVTAGTSPVLEFPGLQPRFSQGWKVTTRTDGNFQFVAQPVSDRVHFQDVGGVIRHMTFKNDGAVGFFGAGGVTRPTITGSRGGNAALASLLTALSQLGLITDSTTA